MMRNKTIELLIEGVASGAGVSDAIDGCICDESDVSRFGTSLGMTNVTVCSRSGDWQSFHKVSGLMSSVGGFSGDRSWKNIHGKDCCTWTFYSYKNAQRAIDLAKKNGFEATRTY